MSSQKKLVNNKKGTSPLRAVASFHADDTDRAVYLWGDGDHASPQEVLRRLQEFHDEVGLEVDYFSRGGTVEQLEHKVAAMLGKEAAIFMPTGTLANHLAIRTLCQGKPRAIVQEQSHLYHDSGDCVERLSGIKLIPLGKDQTAFTLEELKEALAQAESGRVAAPVGAVMIESPVRRRAGQIVSYDQMKQITRLCREQGIPCHLDGARLYMMSAATGIPPQRYAALFNTVYVSLYKYFGAHFGAILAGPRELIATLYDDRRMFGGGLFASYFAAGLALKGMEGFEARLAEAMSRAKTLFASLSALPGIALQPFEHGSNIFPMELAQNIDPEKFAAALQQYQVYLNPDQVQQRRILLSVNTTMLRRSKGELFEAFKTALRQSTSHGKHLNREHPFATPEEELWT